MKSNYLKYRGKCKEFCDAAIKKDPSLTLVRGFYYCPLSNKEEQHWWTKKQNGTIYDPTAKQFLSNGVGEYREFDGIFNCENCGKPVKEEDIKMCGNFPCCSNRCCLRLVGL